MYKTDIELMRKELEQMQERLNIGEGFLEKVYTATNWYLSYDADNDCYKLPDKDSYNYDGAKLAIELRDVISTAIEKWIKGKK